MVSTALLKNTENLVVRLRNLQNKQHAKDPSKTFSKRRYLCGFRETKRFILCGNVKAVIVATDLEIDTGKVPVGIMYVLMYSIKEAFTHEFIKRNFGV